MRGDFSQRTINLLRERVNGLCSNPECRHPTLGPQEKPDGVINIGVAAHIKAAAPGGKRYDPEQSPEERSSIENAIWLCQNCAKLIDSDESRFTVELLHDWKRQAEQSAYKAVAARPIPNDMTQPIPTQALTSVTKAKGSLHLSMLDPAKNNNLDTKLTVPIPRRPANGDRLAERIAIRLYLTNESSEMARFIQIELFVKAHFFSYDYETEPLAIDEMDNWDVTRLDNKTFRCFFEGGSDIVCHSGKYRDLGVLKFLIPYGESDDSVARVNIPYTISAEKHYGENGLMIIWLPPADSL